MVKIIQAVYEEVRSMFGLSIGVIVGYAVARWFGDSVKSIVQHVYAEVGKVIEEWF